MADPSSLAVQIKPQKQFKAFMKIPLVRSWIASEKRKWV